MWFVNMSPMVALDSQKDIRSEVEVNNVWLKTASVNWTPDLQYSNSLYGKPLKF